MIWTKRENDLDPFIASIELMKAVASSIENATYFSMVDMSKTPQKTRRNPLESLVFRLEEQLHFAGQTLPQTSHVWLDLLARAMGVSLP